MAVLEKTQKKTHKGRWFLLADAGLTIIILIIGYCLLRFNPAEYTPMQMDANAAPGRISPYLTHHVLSEFYNGAQRGEPFTITLDQAGINDMIVHCGWPQEFNGMIFATPFAAVHADRVDVMGKVTYNGVDVVVTIEFKPVFDPNGRFNVGVAKVKTGAVPVTIVAKQMAKRMYREQIGEIVSGPDDVFAGIIASVLADVPFDPVIDTGKGKRFRMESLILQEGKAAVHFVPAGK